MFDLTQRRRRPELMDDPGLDKKQHILALRGLARLNFWSGSVRILWPAIWELLSESPGQSLRLLDIASGAGDVAVGMRRKAVRAGYSLQIDAWDVSPCAVDYARSEAVAQGAQVRFLQGDALRTPIPNDYDVIVSSLFLHHLDEGPATAFVRRMADAAKRLVLVNDLIRCQPGFFVAYCATRLFSKSPIVRTDGPLSVEGAFTVQEVRALAEKAGLANAEVVECWPYRFLLRWKRAQ